MKREIKFRAWIGIAMEYNVTVGRFGAFYVNPGRKGDGLQEDDSACLTKFTTKYDTEHTPIMQFTGLFDKNGREIWEGDLVALENWEPNRYEVVFNRGGFCLKFGEDSHFYPDIKYAEDSEVIGNIYENPELIK